MRRGLEDKEYLLAIKPERLRVAIDAAAENLIPAKMAEVAAIVAQMGKFFRGFGVDVNETVIEHWTRVLVGKPLLLS